MSYRMERINSEMQKTISEIIHERLKDPRITEMVSVLSVSVSKDLKTAKVIVSIYGEPDKADTTFQALIKSAGFIRHEMSVQLKDLRAVPQLRFVLDKSGEYSERIESLIEEIKEHDTNRGN